MIKESFIFLPKISERKERKIWQHASTWNEFLDKKEIPGIAQKLKHGYDKILVAAREALIADDASYFARLVHSADQWRLYAHFKDDAVFLDIETASNYGNVTVVGLSDGRETKTLIAGSTLTKENLQEALKPYKLLVTFNGKSFDIPILQKYFNTQFNMPHIDLKHVCFSAGITGGLKLIEKQLGIQRAEQVKDVQGSDADLLWRKWRATGNQDFLDLLVQYNAEDCINLKTVAERVIPQLWKDVRGASPDIILPSSDGGRR